MRQVRKFDIRREHLGEVQIFDERARPVEYPPNDLWVVSHRGQTKHSELPSSLTSHFRDRDVESISNPLGDGPNNAAFLFERLGAVNENLYDGCSDDHSTPEITLLPLHSAYSFRLFIPQEASKRRLLKSGRLLLEHIGFNNVTHLDVIVVFDTDTALETRLHFAGIVLEPLQRSDLTLVDLHAVA